MVHFSFKIGSRVILLSLGLMLLVKGKAGAQEATFEAVRALADQAIEVRADLLSPEHFREALQAWKEARADSGQERHAERMRAKLSQAQQSYTLAIKFARQAAGDFGELIAAHDSAQAANASELAPKTWAKAIDAFQSVIQHLEDEKPDKAQKESPAAMNLLRQAELEAIQTNLLGQAKETLTKAASLKADKLAPLSYRQAASSITMAEDSIAADRYNWKVNRRLAAQAEYAGRHAIYLAQRIAELKKKEDWEGLILEFERDVSELAEAMGQTAQYDQGLNPPVETIRGKLLRVLEDRNRLQAETTKKDSVIGLRDADIQRLQSQSGQYASELESKRQELELKKRHDEKISKVTALFKPSDGIVLQRGDSLVIRLTGLQFAANKAELKPVNFDLLDRVQQAIAEFPDRSIEVQGHTDSQGKAEILLELSKKRAEAVRDYLVTKMGLTESRISAVGLGATVPVAPNDTPAGRVLNRRIEIVLKP